MFSENFKKYDICHRPGPIHTYTHIFETSVHTLTALEDAGIVTSVCNSSEHALGSLGITRGHFGYLCSSFEYRGVLVGAKTKFQQDEKDTFRKLCGCFLNMTVKTAVSIATGRASQKTFTNVLVFSNLQTPVES